MTPGCSSVINGGGKPKVRSVVKDLVESLGVGVQAIPLRRDNSASFIIFHNDGM